MPPTDRFVPRFAAEPPQDLLPYGRWAATLRERFLAAVEAIDPDGEDLGEPEAVTWFPDRSWQGRTYVPAVATTTTAFELFGFVSYASGGADEGPDDFVARADFTDETAARHPEWRLDLCDEVVGSWRGDEGRVADMTLVWGFPLVPGGAVATGELADLVVDQCTLAEERFTLLAPDAYAGDTLQIKLYDARGHELAWESLYAEVADDDDVDSDEEEDDPRTEGSRPG